MKQFGRLGMYAFVGVVAFAAYAGDALAQPSTLTQQGRLFDQSTGEPVSGTETVTFSLYDEEGAGTALWSEMHVLDFDDGYFHAELGGATPFNGAFDTVPGQERWIGVTIDGDELLPRRKLGMVPYALRALDVTGDITPTSVSIDGHGPVIDDAGNWVGPPVATFAGGGYDIGIGFTVTGSTAVGHTLSNHGNTPLTVSPERRILVMGSAMPRRTTTGSTHGYLHVCAMPEGGGTPIIPPAYQGWTYFTFETTSFYDRQFTSTYVFSNLDGAYYFTICGRSYAETIDFRGPQVRSVVF